MTSMHPLNATSSDGSATGMENTQPPALRNIRIPVPPSLIQSRTTVQNSGSSRSSCQAMEQSQMPLHIQTQMASVTAGHLGPNPPAVPTTSPTENSSMINAGKRKQYDQYVAVSLDQNTLSKKQKIGATESMPVPHMHALTNSSREPQQPRVSLDLSYVLRCD